MSFLYGMFKNVMFILVEAALVAAAAFFTTWLQNQEARQPS